MPVRRKTILVQLCCLLLATSIKSTGLRISQHSKCLRKCHLDRREGAEKGMQVSRSILSCHEQCLLGREVPQALTGQTIKQRRRKSLHNLDITKSSTDCPSASLSPAGDWTPSEVEVAFGQYVNTMDWYVNATWTSMNDSLGNWSSILIRLSVEVPEMVVDPSYCFVVTKVHGIPFTTGSSTIAMYLPPTTEAKPVTTTITTHTGSGKTTTPAPSTNITADTESGSTRNVTPTNRTVSHYVAISLGILVGLVLTAIPLLVYIRRCKTRPVLLPEDYKYHAFIIYNHEDILWTKELLTFLEEKHNLKCCIHYRDFEPGVAYPKNMAKSVYESYKVIAVFSKNFLKSNDCIYELDLAIYRRVKKRDNSLVVIRIDDVDSKYLPAKLKKINFIDYSSIWERPFWKYRLLAFLGFSQDSGTQDTVVEHNGGGYRPITGRPAYGRLDSTTSADSAISTTSYV